MIATAPPPMTPPAADSASALLERARAGDVAAFEALVARYRPAALAPIVRKLSDPHEQEDAWQETLLAAWRGLGELRDGARFGGWLGQIATRKADGWHRRRYAQLRMLDLLGEPDASTPAEPPTPSPALAAAFRRLSRDHRRVILGHYYEGQTYEQLSASLQIPTGLVRSRLQKARSHLKHQIETMQRTESVNATIHFSTDEVATLVALSAACYDGPDPRPALRGVLLDGPRGRATATDGRHLLTRPLDALANLGEPLILGGWGHVRGTFAGGATLTPGVDAATLRDDGTGEEFSLPIIDADFPDYARFLALAPTVAVTVDFAALHEAVENLPRQAGGATRPLHLHSEDGELVIAGASAGEGLQWCHEARLVATPGATLTPARADAALLAHALRALRPASRVTLGWDGALDAILLANAARPDHRALVMPVKVTEE